MATMADAGQARRVTGGVDTHAEVHVAGMVDQAGRVLGTGEFPVSAAGYRAALAWMRGHGELVKVGVEGTGSYGAGLARYLAAEGVEVTEVIRPNRQARRRRGKSDTADAVAAALAALNGEASGTPKSGDGAAESIRALQVARRGAVKARTQAGNQLRDLILTAPGQLRDKLAALTTPRRVALAARFRPGDLASPAEAAKAAMAAVAHRHQALTAEIAQLDTSLEALARHAAPAGFLARAGIGTQVASILLTTAGDNPGRCAPRRASPRYAAPARSMPPPGNSAATGSTAAGTGRPTPRCGGSSSPGWPATRAPRPTWPGAPPRARPGKRSCAASSGTSPARSTRPWSPRPATPRPASRSHRRPEPDSTQATRPARLAPTSTVVAVLNITRQAPSSALPGHHARNFS